MDNKSSLNKWLTGYFIFLALILTIDYFIDLNVDVYTFVLITGLSYMGIYYIKSYKAVFVKIIIVSFLFILLVYGMDSLLTSLSGNNQQDFVIENSAQVSGDPDDPIESEKRHNIAPLHNLRDFLDYKNATLFGRWVIFERIETQVIEEKEIEFNKKYEFYMLILLSLSMSTLMGVVVYIKYLKILLIVPIFFYVWLWYKFIDLPLSISGLYFGGAVAFFIMDQHEKLIERHQGYHTSYYPAKKLMRTSLVMGLIIILLSGIFTGIFPVKRVNALVDRVTPNLWGARSGYLNNPLKMYSLQDTPFGASYEQLGGPVGPLDKVTPIFWVKFDQKIEKPVYLKTSIKDQYDGLKWINNGLVYKNEFKYYIGNEDNVKLLMSGAYEKISGFIKINKKVAKTITLFTPMGLYDTSLGSGRVFVSAENEAFYKSGAFVKFLNEYEFTATGRDFNIAKDIDYLQTTNRIEARTTELALKLGELGETDYEKMRILTEFLSQNYTYSLTPLKNINRRDFVSEFLFESRKGYCTYFASALAIMARINGIPSRYVEGFRIDPNEVGTGEDLSKVTERDAHAWAEVYLEGYGWIIFESTPVYSEVTDLEGIPSLEELLKKEEENNVSGAHDAQTKPERPFNLEDLLPEGYDGTGETTGTLGDAQTNKTKSNILTGIYVILALGLMALVFLTSKLPITYLNRRTTHGYAIRRLYYLAYLISESRGYESGEPEVVFSRANFSKSEINLWVRVLYDKKEKVTSSMVVKTIDALDGPIITATQAYKDSKGKIAYLKMRYFKIDTLIP